MPIYPIVCPCGNREDVFCKVKDLDAKNRPQCPKCGKRVATDLARAVGVQTGNSRIHGNPRFHGAQQRSWEEGWNPKDVEKARKLMGADGANCIRDDGTVWFKDAAEAKRYKDKINRMHDRINPPKPPPSAHQADRRSEEQRRTFAQKFKQAFPRGLETE